MASSDYILGRVLENVDILLKSVYEIIEDVTRARHILMFSLLKEDAEEVRRLVREADKLLRRACERYSRICESMLTTVFKIDQED